VASDIRATAVPAYESESRMALDVTGWPTAAGLRPALAGRADGGGARNSASGAGHFREPWLGLQINTGIVVTGRG